jgi:hypothetical protein
MQKSIPICHLRTISLFFLVLVGAIGLTSIAEAEVSADVYIWNGITGYGNTYGASGGPGTAYAYSTTTDNIYYQEAFMREWGVIDYLHILDKNKQWRYYSQITPTIPVSWWGGSDYVTTKHTFKSTTTTSVVTYTRQRLQSHMLEWQYQCNNLPARCSMSYNVVNGCIEKCGVEISTPHFLLQLPPTVSYATPFTTKITCSPTATYLYHSGCCASNSKYCALPNGIFVVVIFSGTNVVSVQTPLRRMNALSPACFNLPSPDDGAAFASFIS